MAYQNKIVRYGMADLDQLLFHPSNWRIHPSRQQDAVKGVLNKVGYVKEGVIINLRTSELWPAGDRNVETMLDGHLRSKLAKAEGETHIPAIWVDLTPEEEDLILSSLDPLGALAVADNKKLQEIAARLPAQSEIMKAAFRGAGIDIRETFLHMEGQKVYEPGAGEAPREPEVHVNSGQEPAGGSSSKPADREKFPLAVVLDRRDYDRWQEWKALCGQRNDTAALKALLDKAKG